MRQRESALDDRSPSLGDALVPDAWPTDEYRHEVASRVATYLRGGGALSTPDGAGPVADLERAYAVWTTTDFALALNSGTSALLAAYHGLGVREGDRVIVSAYGYHAVATVLLQLGATPLLCDVDPATGELDLEAAEHLVTGRVTALAVTHHYGHPADLPRLREFADRHGLRLLQDCSHAHGATIDGVPLPVWGDVAVYSLQESKLAPSGEGGVLVTDDPTVYERALLVSDVNGRLHQLRDPALAALASTGLGLKLRMHPLAAIAGAVGQELCARTLDERRATAAHYARLMAPAGFTVRTSPGAVHLLFRALAPAGMSDQHLDGLLADARSSGVPLRRASLRPLYELFLYSRPSAARTALRASTPWPAVRPEEFPGTRAFAHRLMSLPMLLGARRAEDRETFAAAVDGLVRSARTTVGVDGGGVLA